MLHRCICGLAIVFRFNSHLSFLVLFSCQSRSQEALIRAETDAFFHPCRGAINEFAASKFGTLNHHKQLRRKLVYKNFFFLSPCPSVYDLPSFSLLLVYSKMYYFYWEGRFSERERERETGRKREREIKHCSIC